VPSRVAAAEPPYAAPIQDRLARLMPKGLPPLRLFTTLARDQRLFQRCLAGALLDAGHLTLRQREIVIARVTALCGAEYEWGVHIALFAEAAGFRDEHVVSLAGQGGADPIWSEPECALLRACDQLHQSCDLDDGHWQALQRHFSDEAMLEILMLAGYYRMISYLSNALRLPLEPYGVRFPTRTGH
jgi:alkylhydroperoxidase family enzyme